MKKISSHETNIFAIVSKHFLILFIAILSFNSTMSQVINEGFEEPVWTNFGTGTGASTFGQVVLPNVAVSSTMSYLTGNTSYTTAINTCNNAGTWYFSKATSLSSSKFGFGAHSLSHSIKISSSGYIITPLTPAAVVNITFWASNSTGTIIAGLATDPNAAGPFYNSSMIGAPAQYSYITSTYPQGNQTMQSYSFGGTYSGPCRFGIFNPGGVIYVDDIEVYQPTGTPPTVITGTATPAITSAQVSATITPGTLPLLATGIIWSTTPLTGTVTDTLQSKTKDIPASISNFTDKASPLNPVSLYYAEAYAIGLDGSFYAGQVIQFTTNHYSIPTVVTDTCISILSYQATARGTITDSGGCTIIKKGVVWGTSANPVTGTANQTIEALQGAGLTSNMKPLLPGQLYHYRAYAINSCFPNVVAYGSDSTFTTLTAVPSVVAIPGTLNFGNEYINNPPVILSYILNGNDLNAGDSIIVNAPAGYTVSLTPGGPFITSLAIHYSGTAFSKPIYVQLSTTIYGVYTGQITHSGGGTTAQNTDAVTVKGSIVQSPDQLSNTGTDFWTGFGYEEAMKTATNQFDTATGTARGAHFTIYITTGNQAANVVVDIPGMPGSVTFPRTVTIAANSMANIEAFPVGDGVATNPSAAFDTRLYYTGISSRGIHVYSTNGVPVACWLYDWATNNSAAGAIMYPSNLWSSSYTVQSYGGTTSNTGIPNSFFFVIANDDNTLLTINPTGNIIDSASSPVITLQKGGTILYPKGVPFTILLPHKGDVFNAMGMVNATTGISEDLTGTTVSTDCSKKIAVYGGNGRTLINTAACNSNTSGSDNLLQQMLPKSAWGTKYFTLPTKNMEFNMFRVMVQDPSTKILINNTLLYTTASTTWNATGSFYEFASNQPMTITGDKPFSVCQFIMPGGSCGGATVGNNGGGDPEMIILSPVQQAIKSTTVFTPAFKSSAAGGTSGGAYINVIIPTAGVAGFTIDGNTLNSIVDTGSSSYGTAYGVATCTLKQAFALHQYPGDTSYTWAKFHVTYPALHILSSNVAFNAIAYGVSNGESWGYNAGTAIRNLVSNPLCQGPCLVGNNITACVNNPVNLQIALPYPPSQVDSIIWNYGVDNFIAPFTINLTGKLDTISVKPIVTVAHYDSVSVQNGDTFYVYTCPVPYTFSANGLYDLTATAMGKFASDCPGISVTHIYVQVGNDVASFTAIPAGCGSTSVTFTDNSTAMPGTYITKRVWDYGDKSPQFTTTDSSHPNPVPDPHIYANLNIFTSRLTTTNSIGCISSDSVIIDLSFIINAKFTLSKDTVHTGDIVTFTDGSSSNANKWIMNYGDGRTDTFNQPVNPPLTFTHLYTNPGIYIDSMIVFTAGGCPSNYYVHTIYVLGAGILPVTKITNLNGCNSTTYNNTVYTSSTVVRDTVKSSLGVDSIYNVVNITITKITPTSNTTNLSSCDSIVYNNIVFKNSISFMDTLKTTTGCDSVYATVNIVINNINISGGIYHPSKGYVIPNVSVVMKGSNTQSMLANNSYSFNCMSNGVNETIRLKKNNDITKTNGVTALDIALIQSNILSKSLLNSPYKLIAADVTGDGKVTTLDIVYIKRLVLGIDTTFTNSTTLEKRLWTFVDSSYKFPDSTNPFPYRDSISFTGMNTAKTNQTFVGCKLGDVNWDWNPSVAKPQINILNAIEFSYQSDAVKSTDGYIRIPVKIKNFKDMLGMQFTISFDPAVLSWQGIGNNPLNIETGTTHAVEGSISFLWVDPKNEIKTLSDGSVLFELMFKKIDNGQLIIDNGNTLNLNGDITTIAAYDKDYNLHSIVMYPSLININDITKETWTIAPNPASEGVIHVQMNLKDRKTIVFRLTDITGKLLMVKEVEGTKGSNNIILREGSQIPAGTYYLQANGVEGEAVKKIIIN